MSQKIQMALSWQQIEIHQCQNDQKKLKNYQQKIGTKSEEKFKYGLRYFSKAAYSISESISRPQHPKNVKDEVKRPKGVQLEVRSRS